MKNSLSNFIKNNKWIFFTGFLSSIIVIFIYLLQKIAPLGNNSMLDVDFYHQYGPLLNELYDRVKQGETLLYSFNTGGGIPFYRNILNYLSSPFNILLFLFRKENIVMAFSIIIGLKAVFSSITMSYYLKNTFRKNTILVSLFSCFYAFCGYFCAYYWNIMWLDGMVFLPLIMVGINKIIQEEKPNVYIISLAVMLFANYFIGYMICIFSVFYFLGVFIYKQNFKFKNILKKCLMYILSSLLAAGLVAFALLPLFCSLSSISATGDKLPSIATSFSITNYVFNHLTGVSRTVFASDILPLPNIYPGMLTLALIIVLFANKKINIRFKIICGATLLFFFFSFNINVIDFVWHAFHVPNDLPWRYSFIYVFVLISIGYYSILRIKDVGIIRLSIPFAIVFIITMLSTKLGFQNITDQKAIICLCLLTTYYVICIIYKYKSVNKKFLYTVFSLLVLFECIYSVNINWQIDHDIKTFMQDKKPYMNLISEAKKDDNGLYRMEKTDYLTLNDGAWYDYYGISTFSSMAYENVSKVQRNLGLAGNNINSFYYKEYQTPVYNTMFNIKYIMGKQIENDYYDFVDMNDNNTLMKYNYSSSLVYAVNNEVNDWNLVSYNPFLNQSNFVFYSTGVNNVFNKVLVSKKSDNASLQSISNNDFQGELSYKINDQSNYIILTLDNKLHDNIYLYIGGNDVKSFEVEDTYYSLTSDEYYVFDIGKTNKDTIDVKINFNEYDEGTIYFNAYTLNKEAFSKFYNIINDESLKISRYNDTFIEGDIKVNDDKTLFTTIPYDNGWSVYIDDKKVATKEINSFLSCDIPKGTHKVRFEFYPSKMRLGLIITGVSFMLLVLYNFFAGEKTNKKDKKDKFIV